MRVRRAVKLSDPDDPPRRGPACYLCPEVRCRRLFTLSPPALIAILFRPMSEKIIYQV